MFFKNNLSVFFEKIKTKTSKNRHKKILNQPTKIAFKLKNKIEAVITQNNIEINAKYIFGERTTPNELITKINDKI